MIILIGLYVGQSAMLHFPCCIGTACSQISLWQAVQSGHPIYKASQPVSSGWPADVSEFTGNAVVLLLRLQLFSLLIEIATLDTRGWSNSTAETF